MLDEKPLTIGSDFFKEEVAKCDRTDPAVAIGGKSLAHFYLVFLIGGALRDQNLVKRDFKARRLPFEQDAPDAVHADAVEIACHCREQGLHANVRLPQKRTK